MKRKVIISIILIVLIISIAYLFLNRRGEDDINNTNNIINENDEKIDKDEYVNQIDNYVDELENISKENKKTLEASLTELELGEQANDFMTTLEIDEISGTVQVYDDKEVIISPYSDFLDIFYYYYKDNELVMYRREFMGIGGSVNYYFKGGKLIDIKDDTEEEMNFTPEKEEDILERAKNVYDKYVN